MDGEEANMTEPQTTQGVGGWVNEENPIQAVRRWGSGVEWEPREMVPRGPRKETVEERINDERS